MQKIAFSTTDDPRQKCKLLARLKDGVYDFDLWENNVANVWCPIHINQVRSMTVSIRASKASFDSLLGTRSRTSRAFFA